MDNQKLQAEADALRRGVRYDALSIGGAVIVGGIVWMIVDGWYGWYGWSLYFLMGLIMPMVGYCAGKSLKAGGSRGTVCMYGALCMFCLVLCVFNFTVSSILFAENGGFVRGYYTSVGRIVCEFLVILLWILLAVVYLLHALRAVRLARVLKAIEQSAILGIVGAPQPQSTVVMVKPQSAAPPEAVHYGTAPPAYDDHEAYVLEATSPKSPRSPRGGRPTYAEIV